MGNVLRFDIQTSSQTNYGMQDNDLFTNISLSEDTYSLYPKLTRITKSRGGTEKEIEFVYNDDAGTTVNRLQLEEVYEIDDNGNRLPGHTFNYDTTPLPAYHSFQVDHWGYYNGLNYLASPNPTPNSDADVGCTSGSVQDPDAYVSSSLMLPDQGLVKSGVLQGITYPSGGYKHFTYESNVAFKEVQKNYGTLSTESSYPNFNLTSIASGKNVGGLRIQHVSTHEDNELDTDGMPTGTLLTEKMYEYENSGILDFTSYGIEEGYFIDAGETKYWNIHHNNVNILRQIDNRHICYTSVRVTQADGGYRILNYSNFDNDLSGGTTLLDEKPLAHAAQLNPATSSLLLPLRTHTAPYSSRNRERGKLLQDDIYTVDGTLLRSTVNTYTPLNTESAYQVRSINRHYGLANQDLPTARVISSYENARATAYYEYIYPVHLTAQEVTQYDESGANGRITTRNFAYDYTYDISESDISDDNNLRETVITNSDGKVYKTTYTYTTDYNTSSVSAPTGVARGIKDAQDKNIFLPVETLRYLGSDVIGGQITTYQPNGADLVPYQTYRLTFPDADNNGNLDMINNLALSSISSGTFNMDTRYELHTTYEEYSTTGIPKQSTQDGGTPNSVILSDDELLTMASVTNAAYSDIAYTGFETYGNGNWSFSGNTTAGIFGNSAGLNPIASANVSPGTYQISFWSNGGSGSVGGTPIPVVYSNDNINTDNGWDYHSAIIDITTSLVTFTGSGAIDELRLHPVDALMTTSTYDPVTHQTLVTTDENGKPMFYEYDDFERVVAVRDQDGNLATDYQYRYRELPADNTTHNYIRTHSHWIEGASSGAASNDDDFVQSTQYMDGLGRTLQSIVTGKSPLEKDIIQISEYDTDGRQPKRYLPFTPHNQFTPTGDFLENAGLFQYIFHALGHFFGVGQSTKAYQQTDFEASPMSRSKMIRPEGSYHNTPVMVEYNVTGLPAVKDFQINTSEDVGNITDFVSTDLNNTRQTDENGNITITYTDKLGRTILSRKQNTDNVGTTIYHDTYTVYDNFGNVRYVIPPQAVANLGGATSLAGVANLIYEYKYDRRQRMIYKKIPGAAEEEYVYDYLDRVILMQDGNRRAAGEWLFTKYDVLGRVILTGIYPSVNTRSTLQLLAQSNYAGNAENLYEVTTAGIVGYTLTTSFPQLFSGHTIHTINYYNNYDFNQDNTDDVTFTADGDFPLAEDARLNNMLTGTRTNILGTTDLLTTAMWYDKYGRTIQVQADNHLNGTDVSRFDYEFATNVLLKSKRVHTATGQTDLTIAQRYVYDHARRVTDVYHKINSENEVHLKSLQYSELGQVTAMNLHETATMDDYLQSVNYRYNERGWLTRINELSTGDCVGKFCATLSLKVMLEGAILDDGMMHTKLNSERELLPGQANNPTKGQPYKIAPWGYAGFEGKTSDNLYTPDVVDWVLVSLRTDIGADTEIFKAAALLHSNGTVHFEDDTTLPDDLPPVYIVIEHCNHIGVMTPQPVSMQNDSLIHDFTAADSYTGNDTGTGQRLHTNGKWVMLAGEGTANMGDFSYDITGDDKTKWANLNGNFGQYLEADFDRDGDTNGNDKILWERNNGISSRVPRTTLPTAPDLDIDSLLLNSTNADPTGGGGAIQTVADDLFRMRIQYRSTGGALNATPQYNGNISHVRWQVNDDPADIKTYRYAYDQLDRLTEALYRRNPNYTADVDAYSVQDITYDLNGNIQTLQRNGGMNVAIDDLTYGYNGNQLTYVDDGTNNPEGFTDNYAGVEYTFDDNGNMTSDFNKGITSITYNHLNLPEVITLSGGTITFLYDANGNKLRKTVSGVSQDYLGGIEYSGGAIDAIYHEEGRATPTLTGWQYEYYLKDHLGNTRVIFTEDGPDADSEPDILQEVDYYPFGMTHNSPTATNHYLFNGIERQDDLNLNVDMAHFRTYDYAIGRWWQTDPKYDYSQAVYSGMGNNPILYSDPLGDTIRINQNGYIVSNDNSDYLVYLGDTFIGELGQDVDATEFYKNLLETNAQTADDIWNPKTFQELVRTNGEWDLKNLNEDNPEGHPEHIIGLAHKLQDDGVLDFTQFSFDDESFTPGDLGQHHFGVTGKAMGLFPERFMERQAGVAEMRKAARKGKTVPEEWRPTDTYISNRGVEHVTIGHPYGDNPRDNKFIRKGFDYFRRNRRSLGGW